MLDIVLDKVVTNIGKCIAALIGVVSLEGSVSCCCDSF